ncbi:hypothetical protein HBB16_09865 [Pseudonocardia sp. MCCB 268]|nr:hypothetical protein [Pseudonocardia cytotoxica]
MKDPARRYGVSEATATGPSPPETPAIVASRGRRARAGNIDTSSNLTSPLSPRPPTTAAALRCTPTRSDPAAPVGRGRVRGRATLNAWRCSAP